MVKNDHGVWIDVNHGSSRSTWMLENGTHGAPRRLTADQAIFVAKAMTMRRPLTAEGDNLRYEPRPMMAAR